LNKSIIELIKSFVAKNNITIEDFITAAINEKLNNEGV